jgi:signal transduction histidine kinase
MLRQLKRTTIIIGSIALIILSILAYFLSKKSIQPIKIAFNKQKQFVSDASHELKTPLTVISANTDVLQGEIGENKWLNYIKSQTDRMNVLVNDLLNLTRLENNTVELEYKYFNMSKAIVNTALPFECQAFESNKQFEVDVDDNIMLCGSEKHVKQMAAIFIDNALKYSNDGGTVRVSLKRVGDRKLLSVYNTGQGIKEEDTEKIFERFYRSDESRNRSTGGYGLGLAIAKSVIDKHKFKVHVMNQPGKSVCFMVTMQ